MKAVLESGGLYDRLVAELEARGVDMKDAEQAKVAHEFCQTAISEMYRTAKVCRAMEAPYAPVTHPTTYDDGGA